MRLDAIHLKREAAPTCKGELDRTGGLFARLEGDGEQFQNGALGLLVDVLRLHGLYLRKGQRRTAALVFLRSLVGFLVPHEPVHHEHGLLLLRQVADIRDGNHGVLQMGGKYLKVFLVKGGKFQLIHLLLF